MMNVNELKYKETFLTLIKKYREEVGQKYGKFPSFKETPIGNLSPPTQIIFFHSDFPEIELIILFHLQERDDLEFHFYESKNYKEWLRTIESDVLKNPLCKIIGEEEIEMSLANLIRNSMQYNIISVPCKNCFLTGRSESSGANYSVQLLYGTIVNANITELAKKLVIQTPISGTVLDLQQQISNEPPILDGLGSHSDPPVWIDSADQKQFIEKVYGYPPWKSSEIEYIGNLAGYKALICKDGYIAVNTKDKEKALSVMNTLLGSMMVLLNTAFNVARENDLGTAVFSNHSAGLSGGRFWTHSSTDSVAPVVIKRDQIKEIFSLAESVMKSPKLKTELRLALEFKAHERNSEWIQAILIGWLFLEDIYIARIWEKVLQRIQNSDRKSKLIGYDIDKKLEILNILGMIDDDEYKLIMRLKRVRNEAIHEGKIPDKANVTDMLDKILSILRDDLRKVKA